MESLQESLNKFKKQQEKCLSTSKIIAGSKTTAKTPANTSIKLPSPSFKFSNDTEKWQLINKIRKSTVESQIKRVIDLLLKKRQSLTADEINDECYVDVKGNKAVFERLAKNPKVNYDGNRFSYKPKRNVKDQKELLGLIRKFPDGIHVSDLKDAYLTVIEDLKALKADGEIWVVSKLSSQEVVAAYPNDPRVPRTKVDNELKQLFMETELPRDMLDVEKYLVKNGMKPSTDTAKRRLMAEIENAKKNKPKQIKKKKNEISKRMKLTNSHLPELFNNLNV